MKWDLGKMRIGTRMAVNLGVVLVFMGMALVMYHSAIQEVSSRFKDLIEVTEEIKNHATLITDLLQKAGIKQREFELHLDMSLAQEVNALLSTAENEIGDLEGYEKVNNNPQAMADTRKLREQVTALHKAFLAFQKSIEIMGVDLEHGLKGQQRKTAHALEDRILRVDNPLFQVHYLTMRRHEKDFLLRDDKKYLDLTKQSLEQLRLDLNDNRFSAEDRTAMSALLDTYFRALENLAAEQDNLNKVNQTLDNAYQQAARILEEKTLAISQLMDTTEQETLQQARNAQRNAMVTSLIAVFIALVTGAFFVVVIRRTLAGVAASLSASASQIAAAINEQDRISTLQASSVNQTNTTMEELGSSARQSAEQAESAANSAQKAMEASEHGMSRVEDMLQGMNITKTKVDAIAQQILRLSEQTSQISTITATVTDFANETKMLAMNAAVEAVRAGEHGKGFSVLAVEIRKLAEESKRSAERINALVGEIQKATNATVMATEEGGKTVDQGMMVAQNTAEAFAEVSESVNNASQSSQQISLNVRQQAVAIKQVVEAMKSINTGAKESAAGISQIKTGTQVLNDAAQQLKAMI